MEICQVTDMANAVGKSMAKSVATSLEYGFINVIVLYIYIYRYRKVSCQICKFLLPTMVPCWDLKACPNWKMNGTTKKRSGSLLMNENMKMNGNGENLKLREFFWIFLD